MFIPSITSWRDHIAAGHQYLSTATNGGERREVFNNALVFQLAVMALEGFMVGLCQYHHRMPTDHTLSGLMAELGEACPMDRALTDRIRQVERSDDICSLSPERRIPPTDADVEHVLAVGHSMARWAATHLPEGACG